MLLTLTAIEGKSEIPGLTLGPGEYLFGRSEECAIRIGTDNRQAVSRRHCLLLVEPRGAFVSDLRSRNGTWVNSRRVTDRHPVGDGDRLRIGSIVFLVRTAGTGRPDRPKADPCETREPLCRAAHPVPDETVAAPIDRTCG